MHKVIVTLLVVLMLASCGGRDDGAPRAQETSGFPTAPAILQGDGDSTMLTVEVAETAQQRQMGLMGRESLADDRGMVFFFFQKTDGPFWMKNTLIPLSIAFFDEKGTIVKILDMEPCEEDACPTYSPGVDYWGALEVNQGSFQDWDIEEGDRITISR